MLSYDRRKTFPFSAESYSEIAKTRLHGRLKTSPKLETTEQVTSIMLSICVVVCAKVAGGKCSVEGGSMPEANSTNALETNFLTYGINLRHVYNLNRRNCSS